MYAITKYAGELAAQSVGATILRTNFIGRSVNLNQGLAISDWIIKSLLDRKLITLFEDVIFSPLHIKTLCQIVGRILTLRVSGIYNLGSIGGVSKSDLGIRLASELDLDMRYLQIGKLASANMLAKRPLNMTMDCQKFINQFKFDLPNVDREVSLLIKEYKDI
jgi:dTDP-4-dehydrorhamnose reductase